MNLPFTREESRNTLGAVIPALVLWCAVVSSVAHAGDLPYQVEFQGVSAKGLLSLLKSASDLVALKKKPPPTAELLEQRVSRDCTKLTQTLQAQGYFEAAVAHDIDTAKTPALVTLHVDTGALYHVGELRLVTDEKMPRPDIAFPTAADLNLNPKQPLTASSVDLAERRLIGRLKRDGYAFVKVSKRTVIPDAESKAATLSYYLDLGPKGRFGETTITGLERVDECVVRHRIPWNLGDPYNGDLVDKLQDRLRAMGLFSIVQATVSAQTTNGENVPITVTLKERKRRSISASVNYSTELGIGAKAGWENRNLSGLGDRLRLTVEANDIASDVEASYTLPDYRRIDQTLILKTRFAHDSPDAFSSDSAGASAVLERKLSDYTTAGVGLAFRDERTTQTGLSQDYALLSTPLYLNREKLDDKLDPSEGSRFNLKITPFADLFGHGNPFLKSQIEYRRLIQVSKDPGFVLLGRITAGSILGDHRLDIPADERFYAGGESSIRGYGYQLVSPLKGNKPIGGKSLLTFSGEGRYRIKDNLDLIAFVDGGNAYKREAPDLGRLLWGAGAGVCYHSKVGPIRVDVAVPLNRREGIDDSFQVYVTLGNWF